MGVFMSLKFRGNYHRLKKAVTRTGLGGAWRELKYGQKQYRADDGGMLNWWEKTGTISFQGIKTRLRRSWRRRSLPRRKNDLLGYIVGKCFALACGACIPSLIHDEPRNISRTLKVPLELPIHSLA